jgi:hypothetical protein
MGFPVVQNFSTVSIDLSLRIFWFKHDIQACTIKLYIQHTYSHTIIPHITLNIISDTTVNFIRSDITCCIMASWVRHIRLSKSRLAHALLRGSFPHRTPLRSLSPIPHQPSCLKWPGGAFSWATKCTWSLYWFHDFWLSLASARFFGNSPAGKCILLVSSYLFTCEFLSLTLLGFLTHPDSKGDLSQGCYAGICSTDLRLYTSTKGLKQVYRNSLEILYIPFFGANMCLNIIWGWGLIFLLRLIIC